MLFEISVNCTFTLIIIYNISVSFSFTCIPTMKSLINLFCLFYSLLIFLFYQIFLKHARLVKTKFFPFTLPSFSAPASLYIAS